MELVIEPAPDLASLQTLAERIAAGELVRRSVVIGQPDASIGPGSAGDALAWDGRTLTTLHGPAWRLLIVGAGQISTYLAQMAQALDYQVYICDPRSEYAAEWNVPGTTLVPGMPDDAVIALGLDPHSAVVALTHDAKLDDMVLLEALKSPAFYVGALGSRINNERRRERLLQYFDLSQAEVDRLYGPVGLPIGSRTPPEIAVSILAEMTAVKNGEADGWLVALADMPYIEPVSYLTVLRALQNGAGLARPTYQGKIGHPVGFSANYLPDLLTLTGDQGGKAILDAHQNALYLCPVEDPGILKDIDQSSQLIATENLPHPLLATVSVSSP
jgi:xanthine/CO dehydrogenase XdhC/CoxF family maturation factor